MTAVEALKAKVESLGMKFIHAEMQAANYGLDKLVEVDFPVFVLVSPLKSKNSQTEPFVVRRRISVFSFILKRLDQATMDQTTTQAQPLFESCKILGDKLINKLNSIPETDAEKDGITEWNTDEVYSEFDAHLHGCTLRFDWPTIGLIC